MTHRELKAEIMRLLRANLPANANLSPLRMLIDVGIEGACRRANCGECTTVAAIAKAER